MRGVLRSWNEKGFGFFASDVNSEAGGHDVFCHRTVFEAAGILHPATGTVYDFEIGPSMKRPGKWQVTRVARVLDDREAQIELAWLARQAEGDSR